MTDRSIRRLCKYWQRDNVDYSDKFARYTKRVFGALPKLGWSRLYVMTMTLNSSRRPHPGAIHTNLRELVWPASNGEGREAHLLPMICLCNSPQSYKLLTPWIAHLKNSEQDGNYQWWLHWWGDDNYPWGVNIPMAIYSLNSISGISEGSVGLISGQYSQEGSPHSSN